MSVELGGGRVFGRQREQSPITGAGSRLIDTRPRQRGQQPHPEEAYVKEFETDCSDFT
jgi:hypothetical protein